MLKIESEIKLENFKAWSGGLDRLNKIIELDILEDATEFISSVFENSTMTDVQLNDLLWFEMDDFIESFENE